MPVSFSSSLFSLTDEEAMVRVREQDDPGAFAVLVERWEVRIQRLCTRMTGDPRRGEELAQESFARLFAARKTYRQDARLSTFLWRIALNLCYDERRQASRRPQSLLEREGGRGLEAVAAAEDPPDVVVAERERAEAVREALGRLPEHYRAVLVLRHYQGLKFREIAEVLGVPQGTVKSRMSEALDRLARLLGPVLKEEAREAQSERSETPRPGA